MLFIKLTGDDVSELYKELGKQWITNPTLCAFVRLLQDYINAPEKISPRYTEVNTTTKNG